MLPERHTLKEAARLIPEDAELCVQNNLGPHLSQRRAIRTYPSRCDKAKAQYIFLHLRYGGGPYSGLFPRSQDAMTFQMPVNQLLGDALQLIRSREWGLIFQKDGFYVFARGAAAKVDPQTTFKKFQEDAKKMENDYKIAKTHYLPWAGYATGSYSWEAVMRLIKF